jgi:hypothetical protein
LQSEDFLRRFNLGIPSNWDIQVRWRYPRMGASTIVALNNAGVVATDGAATTHTLHTAQGPRSVTVRWADILTQVPTPVTALGTRAATP